MQRRYGNGNAGHRRCAVLVEGIASRETRDVGIRLVARLLPALRQLTGEGRVVIGIGDAAQAGDGAELVVDIRREREVLVAEGIGQRPYVRRVERPAVLEEVDVATGEVEVAQCLHPTLIIEARHPLIGQPEEGNREDRGQGIALVGEARARDHRAHRGVAQQRGDLIRLMQVGEARRPAEVLELEINRREGEL